MSKITAEETVITILDVEERLARSNSLIISNLRPESALLKNKASLLDALKPFGISSTGKEFETLAIIKKENAVVMKTVKEDGGSALLSKIKFFLEELFVSNEQLCSCRVAWISEDEARNLLDKFELMPDGTSY